MDNTDELKFQGKISIVCWDVKGLVPSQLYIKWVQWEGPQSFGKGGAGLEMQKNSIQTNK